MSGETEPASHTEIRILPQGFTQEANYSKATVNALEQITDGANTAMARFHRDMRNAQIRDEHTVTQPACNTADGGVSTQSAAVQAFGIAAVIAHTLDQRGEAGPGMPSHNGAAQGVASKQAEHVNLYCNADDVTAGLCTTPSNKPNADQEDSSLFGSGVYADQNAVNDAKNFAVNLIQPVAPADLLGDQLTTPVGQEASVKRRSYNARMSLAKSYVATTIGMQSPSMPLTPVQQKYLQDIGLPAQTTGSWLQVLQIEAERRVSDITWQAALQSMPPASVSREIAGEIATTNYLLFQIFRNALTHTAMTATTLAEDTERTLAPAISLPSPNIASN